MKAVRIVATPHGGTPEIHDVPAPRPGPGEVLVRVHASSLNRGELLQAGRVTEGSPKPIGVELAGEIAEFGDGVTGWQVGDAVVGHGQGTQAEYATVSAEALVRKPESVGWVEAGCFLNVYMTAHDALVTNGLLDPSKRVLANAASGGVGLASIQIARALGARTVIGTSRSSSKVDRLAELGADIIDLSTTDQVGAVEQLTEGHGVDVIIDTVGGTVLEDNLSSLAVEGRLVHVGRLGSPTAQLDLTKLWLKRLHLIGVTFRTRSEAERIACIRATERDLLTPWADREIVPVVDSVFPAERIVDGYAAMERGGQVGKIALTFSAEAAREGV